MIRVSFGINNLITTKLSEPDIADSNKKSFWCILNARSSYRLIDESFIHVYPGSVSFTDMGEHCTYVNPAEPGGNQSRILYLSCCWKELVFLHVLKGKARTSSFLYS